MAFYISSIINKVTRRMLELLLQQLAIAKSLDFEELCEKYLREEYYDVIGI